MKKRKAGRAPNGPNHPALHFIRRTSTTWRCRVCSYSPIGSELCPNCGRDWFGNPGSTPEGAPIRHHIPGDA